MTTGARHDNQPYLKQLERVRAHYQITIREAIADRGYGSADIIRTIQGQQASTFTPLWNDRVSRRALSKSLNPDTGEKVQREKPKQDCLADDSAEDQKNFLLDRQKHEVDERYWKLAAEFNAASER